MSDFDQRVKTGDGSTVVQAGTVVIHQGMTEAEVKLLAIKIFEENMPRLEQIAKETALSRANQLISFVVERAANNKSFKNFERLSMPRKQNDFINAQKAYAFSDGDEVLKGLLGELLNKSLDEENEQSLTSISLSVAIQASSNLTRNQLLILGVCYYFGSVLRAGFSSIDAFVKDIESDFEKLGVFDLYDSGESDYLHLEAMSCIAVNSWRGGNLWGQFLRMYPGAFSLGVEEEEVAKEFIAAGCTVVGVGECIHDKHKQQVLFPHVDSIQNAVKKEAITPEQGRVLEFLLKKKLMDQGQVKELFSQHSERIVRAASLWESGLISTLRLTTVGKTIGYNVSIGRLGAKSLSLIF